LAIGSSESSSLPPFLPASFLPNSGLKFSYFLAGSFSPLLLALGVGTGLGCPSVDESLVGATDGSFFFNPGY